MLSLSITFPPDCAERTNLLSQTSLKTLIELSKKCRWPPVSSVLDPPEQIEAMFPKLDASQIAGISATKFAFPEQREEPLENVSHVRTAVARFNQVKGVTDAERSAFLSRSIHP
jgi:hypothetical protein